MPVPNTIPVYARGEDQDNETRKYIGDYEPDKLENLCDFFGNEGIGWFQEYCGPAYHSDFQIVADKTKVYAELIFDEDSDTAAS